MKRDLLIPSSWSEARLVPLLASISASTAHPNNIIFLIHWTPSEAEIKQIEWTIDAWLSELNETKIITIHYFNNDYQAWHWTWFDRQYLSDQAISDYLYMIDDDNIFDPDFFEKSLEEFQTHDQPILYSPRIMRRDSWTVQSQWITWFSWLMPKYRYAGHDSTNPVKMIWANSLLGSKELFQSIWFDSRFATTLEDIDFSYRVSASWVSIIVSKIVEIQHMEREKSFLEKKFLWSPTQAYERSKNRILFAKKNASSVQKLQYFGLGLWAQTVWFLWLALLYGGTERRLMIQNILRGTKDGIRNESGKSFIL